MQTLPSILLLQVLLEDALFAVRKAYLRKANQSWVIRLRSWWCALKQDDKFQYAMRRPREVVDIRLSEDGKNTFTVELLDGLVYQLGTGDEGIQRYVDLNDRIHWAAREALPRKQHPVLYDPKMTVIPVLGCAGKGGRAPELKADAITRQTIATTTILAYDAPPEFWALTPLDGERTNQNITMDVVDVWGGEPFRDFHD